MTRSSTNSGSFRANASVSHAPRLCPMMTSGWGPSSAMELKALRIVSRFCPNVWSELGAIRWICSRGTPREISSLTFCSM